MEDRSIDEELAKLEAEGAFKDGEELIRQIATIEAAPEEEPKDAISQLMQQQSVSKEEAEKALNTGYNPNKFDPQDPGSKGVREFNRMGELLDKFEKSVEDNRRKDEVIKELAERMDKREQLAYERALRALEAQRQEAVNEGDVERFNAIDTEYRQTQQDLNQFRQPAAPQQNQEPEVFTKLREDFEKRNAAWYNNDSPENYEMFLAARREDERLSIKYPTRDPAENVRDVEMYIRKAYANHPAFQNSAQQSAPRIGQNENKLGASKHRTLDDLSPRQKMIFRELRAVDSEMTVDKYIEYMG